MNLAFDVSDIVVYVQGNRRLSGIQRLVLSLIRHAAAQNRADIVFCDPPSGEFFRIDMPRLFDGEYSAGKLSSALGAEGRAVPPRFRYRGRPMKLVFHETKYQLGRLLSARRPPAGFKTWRPDGKTRYVVLGAPWSNPRLESALRRVAQECEIEPIILIHDLRPIAAPEHETFTNHAFLSWFSSAASLYERFLVYSAHTENDLREHLTREGRRIEWIRRIGMAHEFSADGETPVSELKGRTFVLTVGPLHLRHKNAEGLIAAWAEIAEKLGEDTPILVFAGTHGKGISKIEQAQISHSALRGRVVAVNEPSDSEMAWLYRNCRFSVFPSFFEGWGLPVGESAWMGKLCIASNQAAIPEVLGEHGDYFDPYSQQSMVESLLHPLLDHAYLRRREEQLKRMKLRTWKESATDMIQAVTTL